MHFQADYIVAIIICICFVGAIIYGQIVSKRNEKEEKNKKNDKQNSNTNVK